MVLCMYVAQNGGSLRVGVHLVQEATAIVLVEDSCETPGLFLEGLYILDLDNENVSWLRALDLKWAC